MEIKVGTRGKMEMTVTKEVTASAVGSGAVEVFGTPFMIGMMEGAALTSLQPFLDETQGTVGTNINVSHTAPTPIGMKVWAESEVTNVTAGGKIIDFKVTAYDEMGVIGTGTHQRAIIRNDAFLKKAADKLAQWKAAK
ncbi:thioesterase family protein [Papillibacter cinnamivorans]|uniref:Predicted thioesterase n=1 Tax=Papillibacter cinnamivorans DSM 12816 TaxID=1122930 RepID=A0A1W1YLR8_9FIRM|nr:thioesterase family protein [Papillibacter cinnamivorans]SMC37190.1 Predicted thioesterase [Papillibacter cinnamivorans DSM 12816]